jgi:hypothetical protein
LPCLFQVEPAGHDAAEATIDLGQKPTQGAGLVAVDGALRSGRCPHLPHGSDVRFAGTQDGAQLACCQRRAWGRVAAPPGEGREGVVDAVDQIGTTAFEPAQQLAQGTVGAARVETAQGVPSARRCALSHSM